MKHLFVTEAYREDVDRWLARLHPAEMEEMGLSPGDVVTVTGRRTTAVKVSPGAVRPRPGQICLDSQARKNADVSIGEKVLVERCSPKPAQAVVLALASPVEQHLEPFLEPGRLLDLLGGATLGLGDMISPRLYGSRSLLLRVIGTSPDGFIVVTPETCLKVLPPDSSEPSGPRSAYEDIGGLDEQIQKIREMIELPLRYPWLFARLGIQLPKGLLLCGPPGAGKTLIARALASEVRARFIHVDGPEIMRKYYGESEARLREVFEEAARNAPSIIFLDEIDALAPRRSAVAGEVEKRVVAQLLALMDGMVSRGQVIVIGATNMPELLDPALRRPGRFDREIYIGVPDAPGRLDILRIHSRDMPLSEDVDLERIAGLTHGFVGADLEMLCKEAAMNALRRYLPAVLNPGTGLAVLHDSDVKLTVTMEDFRQALRDLQPTAARAVAVEKPTANLAQVVGMDDLKACLLSLITGSSGGERRSLAMGEPRRIALYGPTGTGKTSLVRAFAGEAKFNLVGVEPYQVFHRWAGETEKALSELFRTARQSVPCIIFLDQLDALAPVRGAEYESYLAGRLVAQLIREMDMSESVDDLFVFAATSRPDLVDPAVWSRFDVKLELSLPDEAERLRLLCHFVRGIPLADDVSLEALARRAAGISRGEILGLCRWAHLMARQESTEAPVRVSWAHFLRALELADKAAARKGDVEGVR